MNSYRRNKLHRAVNALDEAYYIVSAVSEEEETAYDNLPESLQESEKGETMQENYEELADIYDEIEALINRIQEVIEK